MVPPVIPLAEAAAAAFPRLDLTEDEARRLAQGARLPVRAPLPAGSRPAASRPPDSLPPSSAAMEANGPEANGPEGNGPEGNGPEGNGPEANGPEGNGPEGNGPEANGPEGNGPEGNGPEANGSEEQISEGHPIAAFAPDDTLIALVTVERGQIRSLAVFADPTPASPRDLGPFRASGPPDMS
jgi:hypothetical protein